MATITAQAKLQNGWRLLCVDKNITANLTSSFSLGNYNRPIQPEDEYEISPDVLGFKILRTASGPEAIASISLTDERYATYGGGNKIGVFNPAQPWTMTAGLQCQFPTYVRFDLEALGVPEGTDIILQLEEGFVIEGEYPGTERKPLPKVDNIMAFRTPKKFAVYPTSSTSVAFPLISRTRPFNIDVISLFSPSIQARATLVGVIDLEMFAGVSPTPNYAPGLSGSHMFSVFGPTNVGGFPEFNINFRTRLFDSTFDTSVFSLPDIPDGRIRLADSAMVVESTVVAETIKTASANLTTDGFGTMDVTAVKTARVETSVSVVSSSSSAFDRYRDYVSPMAAQTSVSTQANYNVGLLRSTMSSTFTAEQSFDLVFEVDTNYVIPSTSQYNYIVDKTVGFYLYSGSGTVLWGDGTSSSYNATEADGGNLFHTYAVDGVYTIRIRGTLTKLGFVFKDRDPDTTAYTDRPRYDRWLGYIQPNGYAAAFTKLKAWGDTGVTNFEDAFSSMVNLTTIPGDLLSPVTNLKKAFFGCRNLVFPTGMNEWDVSGCDSLYQTFDGCQLLNVSLNNWNVSNVTDLDRTFRGCYIFNQPLNNWNVGNVTNMEYTFSDCRAFNQNIDNWNVSNVTALRGCFYNAYAFNQPLNSWNTANVRYWSNGAPNISLIYPRNSQSLENGVFEGARAFNQPLNQWVLSAATALPGEQRLNYMFKNAWAFNQNINTWDVSNVDLAFGMFENAYAFNQSLSAWDVSGWRGTAASIITSMYQMFKNATSYNQDLSMWCVPQFTSEPLDFRPGAVNWTLPKPVWGTCP